MNKGYRVIDVTNGLYNPIYCHLDGTSKVQHVSKVLATLGGNPWCSWQRDTLFQIKKDQRRGHANVKSFKTHLSALDCRRKELTGFEVETKEDGHFVVHCHKNLPQVVLANTAGEGRLKLISVNDET